MTQRKTDNATGRSVAALIFDAYHEYCRNFYPKDPAVYVIRAHPETIWKLIGLHEHAVVPFSTGSLSTPTEWPQRSIWGMKLEGDPRMKVGEIVFGPETISIKWNE